MPLRISIWCATSRHCRSLDGIDCCFSLDVGVMCGVNIFTLVILGRSELRVPAKHDSKRAKTDALLEQGTLNPTPEKVRDPKFQESEFFDPRDAVQVKYERSPSRTPR